MHGQIILQSTFAQSRRNGMACRCNRDVWRKHYVIAYVNMRIVHEREIEIGEYIFAEMHVFSAEICVKGGHNTTIFPNFREHFF